MASKKIEKIIKQLIEADKLEEFLNNEKLSSFNQERLDEIYSIILKMKGGEYIKYIQKVPEQLKIKLI